MLYYNLVTAVNSPENAMSAILPGKFDDGDFDAWVREFDACSEATNNKVLKLPAFCVVSLPVTFTPSPRERDELTKMLSNL